ncbi:hypothetical protein ACV1C4_23095 [Aeromonas hydrophila]
MSQIHCQEDYEQALALMDTLVDDYDANRQLIELLSISIEHWEEWAEEFAELSRAVAGELEP